MKTEEPTPYGSVPMNPPMDNSADDQSKAPTEDAGTPSDTTEAAAGENPVADKGDDSVSKLEKMIQMLRTKLEEIGKAPAAPAAAAQSQGPAPDEQIRAIMQRIDDGEMTLQQGMMEALSINSQLTASQVFSKLDQQRQQEKQSEVTSQFLTKNPDYQTVLESGALQPYLDEDPMADEYVAFHKFKADQKVNSLKEEYEAKIAAAKEEGAKLAKGAEAAGKVLGKQGVSPAAPQVNRPFKSSQEAQQAMMAKLAQIRSASQ